jgi:hypothetical protein
MSDSCTERRRLRFDSGRRQLAASCRPVRCRLLGRPASVFVLIRIKFEDQERSRLRRWRLFMTTIAANTGHADLFKAEPSNQMELLDILARATDASVRDVPRFISAALIKVSTEQRSRCTRSGRARSTTSTTNRCVQAQSLHHTWNRHAP